MQDTRICFIGDSFVNGTGDETMLGRRVEFETSLQNVRDLFARMQSAPGLEVLTARPAEGIAHT